MADLPRSKLGKQHNILSPKVRNLITTQRQQQQRIAKISSLVERQQLLNSVLAAKVEQQNDMLEKQSQIINNYASLLEEHVCRINQQTDKLDAVYDACQTMFRENQQTHNTTIKKIEELLHNSSKNNTVTSPQKNANNKQQIQPTECQCKALNVQLADKVIKKVENVENTVHQLARHTEATLSVERILNYTDMHKKLVNFETEATTALNSINSKVHKIAENTKTNTKTTSSQGEDDSNARPITTAELPAIRSEAIWALSAHFFATAFILFFSTSWFRLVACCVLSYYFITVIQPANLEYIKMRKEKRILQKQQREEEKKKEALAKEEEKKNPNKTKAKKVENKGKDDEHEHEHDHDHDEHGHGHVHAPTDIEDDNEDEDDSYPYCLPGHFSVHNLVSFLAIIGIVDFLIFW